MPLAHFRSHLTKNNTYSIAKDISFDSDIALRIQILTDWGLYKRLPQLSKDSYSVRS